MRAAMRGPKQQPAAPDWSDLSGGRTLAAGWSGSVMGRASYNRAHSRCQPVTADPLAALFAPLTSLRGMGPAVAGLIERVARGDRVIDLLFHMPEAYLDRSARPAIGSAKPGTVATLVVEVVRHERPATSRQPWRIIVKDDTGVAELVFFRFTREAQMPPGARLLVSGKLDVFNGRLTMPHPDHLVPAEHAERVPLIEPVWPMTAGLWPRQIASGLAQALDLLPELPEWHDPALLRRENWAPFGAALRAVQAPTEHQPDRRMRARLAYDELLANQVAQAVIRGRVRARSGQPLIGDSRLRAVAMQRFGMVLTRSQEQALGEIDADLASPRRMLRLLQGDVGSGKTLVALLAMLRAVEAGKQAALMAPTEVLAKQHFRTLTRLCPVPVALLTGSIKGRERARLLRGIKDGSMRIAVGTHALFQEAVEYRDLAVAVIDEQHRFGVTQRLNLGAKGERTDVLIMTATPIPRTLSADPMG